jgi:hypothetical protein
MIRIVLIFVFLLVMYHVNAFDGTCIAQGLGAGKDICGNCGGENNGWAFTGANNICNDAFYATLYDPCKLINGTGSLPCKDASPPSEVPVQTSALIMHYAFNESKTYGNGSYSGRYFNNIEHGAVFGKGRRFQNALPVTPDPELIVDPDIFYDGVRIDGAMTYLNQWEPDFHGSGTYGTIPTGGPTVSLSGDYTFQLVLRSDNVNYGKSGHLLSSGQNDGRAGSGAGSCSGSNQWSLDQISGELKFYARGGTNGLQDCTIITGTLPFASELVNVVMTFKKNIAVPSQSTVKMYINGVLEDTVTDFTGGSLAPLSFGSNTVLAIGYGTFFDAWRGNIFQLTMWGVALNQSDVLLLQKTLDDACDIDLCGICHGTNECCESIGCEGNITEFCNSTKIFDLNMVCCDEVDKGADELCFSGTVFDSQNNTCIPSEIGCDGICNSGAVLDCFNICAGSSVFDCSGVCNGTSTFDCNNVCNGISTFDCNNVCNGPGVEDICGTCDGDNSTCCTFDCFNLCNGTANNDICGVCGGDSSSCCTFDCFNVCNGTANNDLCGVCNGDSSSCCTFDACNICNGTNNVPFFDNCGVECGDNSTCFQQEEFVQKNSSFIHMAECSVVMYNVTTLMFPPSVGSDTIYVTIQAHISITPGETDGEVLFQCNNQTLTDLLNVNWQSSITGDTEWFENTLKVIDLIMCSGSTESDNIINMETNLLMRTRYLNNTFNEDFQYETECCIKASLVNTGTSSNEFKIYNDDIFSIDINVINNDIICNESCNTDCELHHTFQTCIQYVDGSPTQLTNAVLNQENTIGSPPFEFQSTISPCDPTITTQCCQTWIIVSNNTHDLDCYTSSLAFEFDHLLNGTNCFGKTIERSHFIDVCQSTPISVAVNNFECEITLHKDALITTASNSYIDGQRIYGELELGPLPDSDCQKYVLFVKEGRVCVPISLAVGDITGCDDPNAVKHIFIKTSAGYTGGTYFSTSISPHPTLPTCTSKLVVSWFARLLNSFSPRVVVEVDWSFSISNNPYGLLEMSPLHTFRKTIDLQHTSASIPYVNENLMLNHATEDSHAVMRYGLQGEHNQYKSSQSVFKVECGDGYNFDGHCRVSSMSQTYDVNVYMCIVIFIVFCIFMYVIWKFNVYYHINGRSVMHYKK